MYENVYLVSRRLAIVYVSAIITVTTSATFKEKFAGLCFVIISIIPIWFISVVITVMVVRKMQKVVRISKHILNSLYTVSWDDFKENWKVFQQYQPKIKKFSSEIPNLFFSKS